MGSIPFFMKNNALPKPKAGPHLFCALCLMGKDRLKPKQTYTRIDRFLNGSGSKKQIIWLIISKLFENGCLDMLKDVNQTLRVCPGQ